MDPQFSRGRDHRFERFSNRQPDRRDRAGGGAGGRLRCRSRLSNEVIVALNVSLDEVLNNIISYGYEDAGHHDIVVRLELRDGRIEVVVEDDGKPFNPLRVRRPT